MRKAISSASIAAALFGALAGCESTDRDTPAVSADPAAPVAPANLREVTLTVEGMFCATCPVTVKTAAERVAGVESAVVSQEESSARVRFDPAKTTPEQIAAAISKSGYPAKPAAAADPGAAAPSASTKLAPVVSATEVKPRAQRPAAAATASTSAQAKCGAGKCGEGSCG